MPRAAIYARYSSDRQSEKSIDDQIALCRALAQREGWSVVDVFADYEVSGASVHRPEFARLQAAAGARAFEIVVAADTDRLARGEGDMPQLRRQMEFHGVAIHTCSDGHVTKLIAGFKGLTASLFLDNLAQHVHRGMAGVIRGGRSAGGRAYGYRPVAGRPGELAIVEAEAAVVRRIFADYAAGKTPRAIAGVLNRQAVPPPRGRAWNASTINGNHKRGNGILLNPIYAGRIVWNRIRMVKNPATGRRVSRPNPAALHQAVEAPHLRLVEQSLFDAVGAIKRQKGIQAPARSRRPPRLFSGLLRCGQCGGGMSAVGRDRSGKPRLVCSTRRESGQCLNRRVLYIEAVERAALAALRDKLKAPKFFAAYLEEYNSERKRLAREAVRQRSSIERRAGENARELARAIEAVVKGIVDPETLRARIAELTAERDALKAELARADDGAGELVLHPEAIARYRRDVEFLAAGVPVGDGEAVAALRRLVTAVVVHVGCGRGAAFEVEIKGRLAELLRGQGGGSVVAGDRYRRSPRSGEPLFAIRAQAA